MLSFTSSSERRLPAVAWAPILGTALLIFSACVLLMEVGLAQLGYHPNVVDSEAKWLKERARASQLGERAIIVVGGSRIRLGIDLDTLREVTGLEPVQLAIDGDPSIPVLAGLAVDPTIRGTVLVDYYDSAYSSRQNTALLYQRKYYEQKAGGSDLPPYIVIENTLAEMLHSHLRAYADGAIPLSSLSKRILSSERTPQYLSTNPDRSSFADYSLVPMPVFYFYRVIRNLGLDKELDPYSPDIETVLQKKITSITPSTDSQAFIQHTQAVAKLVSAIKVHGGRTLFITMPTSGMVRDIEERTYPRAQFWDRFVKEVNAPAIRPADNPELTKFTCPDGSHLDMHDRKEFTVALSRSLNISRH